MAAETPLLPADDPADDAKVTPFADAHATKLRRAGRFAGLGYPVDWIADRFGVDVSTARGWRDAPAYLAGYASAEGQQARDAAQALSKIALSLPGLVDQSIAVAMDTAHKDSSVERRYLIDKVLTPMTIQHNTTELRADVRFWDPVAAALERVAKLAPIEIPVLVEGPQAAADYGGVAQLPEGSGGLPPVGQESSSLSGDPVPTHFCVERPTGSDEPLGA